MSDDTKHVFPITEGVHFETAQPYRHDDEPDELLVAATCDQLRAHYEQLGEIVEGIGDDD